MFEMFPCLPSGRYWTATLYYFDFSFFLGGGEGVYGKVNEAHSNSDFCGTRLSRPFEEYFRVSSSFLFVVLSKGSTSRL